MPPLWRSPKTLGLGGHRGSPPMLLGVARRLGFLLAEDGQPSEVDVQGRNDGSHTSGNRPEMQLGRG